MIIPALDLIEGAVVRLYQGDYAQKTEFSKDPAAWVRRYCEEGAGYLHLVDLTGAKDPNRRQTDLIRTLVDASTVDVQAGGGIREDASLEALFSAGVARAVIGSVCVREPERVLGWLTNHGPERIVLALDVNVKDGKKFVATHGWQEDSGVTLESLLDRYLEAGAQHVLCTDISRDGTLSGTHHEMYAELAAAYPQVSFQASGGVGSLDDVRAAARSGASSVILGRALLEGRFTVPEAIGAWKDAQ